MADRKAPLRVLVISSSEKFPTQITECLPRSQYYPIQSVSSAMEAKRLLSHNGFDIVIISAPLADYNFLQLALEFCSVHSLGILLLVKGDLYDQVCYRVEDHGIITLPKPTSSQELYHAVKALTAMQAKIRSIENEALSLKEKMEEYRLINRAKWLLIDKLQMNEPDAHRYIEKEAMDHSYKKIEVAKQIIHTYSV